MLPTHAPAHTQGRILPSHGATRSGTVHPHRRPFFHLKRKTYIRIIPIGPLIDRSIDPSLGKIKNFSLQERIVGFLPLGFRGKPAVSGHIRFTHAIQNLVFTNTNVSIKSRLDLVAGIIPLRVRDPHRHPRIHRERERFVRVPELCPLISRFIRPSLGTIEDRAEQKPGLRVLFLHRVLNKPDLRRNLFLAHADTPRKRDFSPGRRVIHSHRRMGIDGKRVAHIRIERTCPLVRRILVARNAPHDRGHRIALEREKRLLFLGRICKIRTIHDDKCRRMAHTLRLREARFRPSRGVGLTLRSIPIHRNVVALIPIPRGPRPRFHRRRLAVDTGLECSGSREVRKRKLVKRREHFRLHTRRPDQWNNGLEIAF